MSFIEKMKTRERTSHKSNFYTSCIGFLGGFYVVFVLLLLTKFTDVSWIMAPFGASCVLVFAVWDSPLSQPRNVIGGQFLSTLIGLLFKNLFGHSSFVTAIAVGLILTRTTHPPAGADFLVILLSDWSYLSTPMLLGSAVIVVFGLGINNLSKKETIPNLGFKEEAYD